MSRDGFLFGGMDDDQGHGRPAFQNTRGLARNDGPDTMHDAADSVANCTGAMRQKVYSAIVAAGNNGLTDDEGERLLDMRSQSYTPRRRELALAGLIETRGRRPTRNGRDAAVWFASGSRVGAPTNGNGNGLSAAAHATAEGSEQ